MSKEVKVSSFLKDFKEKMKFWDVLFRDDRGKNARALIDLELRPIDRKAILENTRNQGLQRRATGRKIIRRCRYVGVWQNR